MVQITAVLTVRNEGAYLLDWIAHHRACGITDFVVLSNNCQDGTDDMLDRLEVMGWLTHIRNDGPYDQGGIQFAGLKLADKAEAVTQADWLLALDIDEFVNVHVGDRTLPALIEALPEADAIALTWRLFGNNGVLHYEDTPITRQFTRAAPTLLYWPWRAAMFKTLYRNHGAYQKLGVHRPRDPDTTRINQMQWYDGEGRALPAQFRTRQIFTPYGRSNYALVQLNHYPLGAMESYVVKADRGRAVHADQMLGLDYWIERNFNTEEDRSIAQIEPRSDVIRAQLAADSVLDTLHEQAVRWRRTRFETLMLQEPFRALLGRLMMTPPTRPLPLNTAKFLVAHAKRAREEAANTP
ncbi:MAG: glycosyltransferase family 2 protein [Rhodobacteraceae bacterium]|nr:glycosyltransferase family 2 protein [Paracoccaceae bacterium]